jgi:ParB family chromosome partitioning protein
MAVAKLPDTGDGRALVILLGMVLATTEARCRFSTLMAAAESSSCKFCEFSP